MGVEKLLIAPAPATTSYSTGQLRQKLAKMRRGMATLLPADDVILFTRGRKLPKAEVLAAIDAELAAFEAFDRLLLDVKTERQRLRKRLTVMQAAIGELTLALGNHVGRVPHLRIALGLAPGKKPRKLKPEERIEATLKLRATRERNGTSAKLRRRRRRS